MRLIVYLLALFIPTAFLSAQNTCQIVDLTAQVVDFNDCQYYVRLEFEHTGTTNQYKVQGNGINYGTFPYSQNPLVLGPFPAAPNGPATREFVVRDAVFGTTCFDEVQVTAPTCTSANPCEIYDVTVEAFDCNPGTNTYHLLLDFEVDNPTNDFFEVWSANGTYLGLFPLNQLPVTIPNFPWNGLSFDKVKICINDNPDCCRVKEFPAPPCTGSPCPVIQNLTVQTGACNPDSTFATTINFQLNVPALTVPFQVFAGSTLLGTFSTIQLPLTIPNFPWNGGPNSEVKICLLTTSAPSVTCCAVKAFPNPACLQNLGCAISDFSVEADTCTSDSTFSVTIDFNVGNPSATTTFFVKINGQTYGSFPVSSLPLTIPNVAWNGQLFQFIRVATGTTVPCVAEAQFMAPACLPFEPCHVSNVMTLVGPCTSDSTYRVRINFQATNPGNGTFTVMANGTALGTWPLSAAPLTIDNFPRGTGATDLLVVCVNAATPNTTPCCAEKLVTPPPCSGPPAPCQITNFAVLTGPCSSPETYAVTIKFHVLSATPNATFTVWANGQVFGTYNLTQLPLTIPNFPWNGGNNDVIKVCLNSAAGITCCAEKEFPVPNCLGQGGNCEIFNLHVQTGDCTSNTTYKAWINFSVINPPSQMFQLWANGQVFGTFNLNQLPLYIPNFPYNGGPNDVVKVCFLANTPAATPCCAEKEFPVPPCLNQGGNCAINDLNVDTGDCWNDNTYNLWVNFTATNVPPGVTSFTVFANGQYFGTFPLSQLPLHIEHFPYNGGPNDVIKVCLGTPNTSGTLGCCETLEFPVPPCAGQGGSCDITNLHVEIGDCTSNTTYEVWVDFDVAAPPAQSFILWANGVQFGTFQLSQLPLHITNFPYNGGPNDFIKVCIAPTNSTTVQCCEEIEFPVPPCLGQGGTCSINDLNVDTGDCWPDSTYNLWVNFAATNVPPGVTSFTVFANGQFFGTFPLNQLPLHIEHFPYNGGPNDVIKVCIGTPNTAPTLGCCETLEFPVPPCLGGGGDDCEIYDLHVQATPCVCGQFFAIVTFAHENGDGPTFDINGNGTNYGTFPYSQQQPIILGPLPGGTGVNYEFVVRDHENHDCFDVFQLGEVDCVVLRSSTTRPGSVAVTPSPATDRVTVNTTWASLSAPGASTVEVFHADGRRSLTTTVPDGASFQLDVAALPAGVYRVVVTSAVGRVEGTFAKQ